MDYYENEFYHELSEFDIQIDDFKRSLMKNIKQEFIDKMKNIQEENIALQEIKNNWESLKESYAKKEQELENAISQATFNAKKLQLDELLKDRKIIMYKAGCKNIKRPKCNKCNDARQIPYFSSFGGEIMGDCDCSKSDYIYTPQIWILYEFKENAYDKELLMWYQMSKESCNDIYFSFYSEICKKVYNSSMNYDDIDRFTFFNNEKDCQTYCDWLNKKEKNQ